LFERWEKKSEKDGYSNFCGDGLIFRGGNWEIEKDGKWYYGKSEGNEEILWEEAPKRILFLLKDTNNNPNDDDAREFRPGADGKIILHYKNLAFWLFGLLAFDETKDAPAFDTLNFWEDVFPVFDTKPYAIVNCKKESGSSSIDNQTLLNHINNYAQFIKEQISILDPDIIVCGGGSSLIIDFVEKNIYPDLVAVNNWICYDEKNAKVIIDSYHPSYFGISMAEIYSQMMNAYKEFLEKYPDFRKSCRK
jgi:hypothetical protein